MRKISIIKKTVALLLLTVVSLISLFSHQSTVNKISDEMNGMKHGSDNLPSCVTFCQIAVAKKEEDIIIVEESEEGDDLLLSPYRYTKINNKELLSTQINKIIGIKKIPIIPIYLLNSIFRI